MLVTCSVYLGIASSQRLTEFLTTNAHSRKPPGPGSGCLRSLDFRVKKKKKCPSLFRVWSLLPVVRWDRDGEK